MGLEIGRRVVLLGWRPKEDHEDERDKPDGKVDVETPTPRGSVGEATTDQRAHDGGETEHQAEQALECGSLVQGNHGNHDQHAAREDAGGCQTSNGPSDDEHDGALSSAANSRAGLKDHHADKKDPIVSQSVKGEMGGTRGVHKGADVTLEGQYGPTISCRRTCRCGRTPVGHRQWSTCRQRHTSRYLPGF